MNIGKDWLESAILDFLAVVQDCRTNTTYAKDRSLFTHDMAVAGSWLVRLHVGDSPASVAEEILSPATTKSITDYWRQGEWGVKESEAFDVLQKSIRGQAT